jgi:hypothetical protein
MTTTLKLKRSQFILLMVVVNAANSYLVPLIPVMGLALFTGAVLNGIIIYLATEEQTAPPA